jgi:signal transduction histidine kinase
VFYQAGAGIARQTVSRDPPGPVASHPANVVKNRSLPVKSYELKSGAAIPRTNLPTVEIVMRLHQFIVANMEKILSEWVSFARSIQPVTMTVKDLRDHAEEMLITIANDLESPQTELERSEKSKGHQPRQEGDTAAEIHADCRLRSGFSVDLLASEYRALRASVLKLWFAEHECSSPQEAEDLIRFNEGIDQALAESITRYTEAVVMSQDIFLGVLGHDLRDPLNSIGVGAQILKHSKDQDSPPAKLGSQMYNSVLRMTKMLDNLLNFTQSRIGGGLQISPSEIDLAQISADVIAEFRLSNPNRIIHNQVEGNCVGNWDAGRLSQTYQNLISNALQYGSVESAVTVVTKDEGDHVVFTVQNYGVPIPAISQSQIFDLMHRIPNVDAERNFKKNLGLGLYIVREIVTAHHGSISVSSTEEKGTIFRVRLPKNLLSAA